MAPSKPSYLPCLLLLAAASLATAWTASDSSTRLVAPVLAWSNQPYFAAASEAATYQVFSDASGMLKQLLSSSLDAGSTPFHMDEHALRAQRPEVVLLVLGSQLKTSDLHSRALRSPLQPLQALLSGAASSLSMPNVLHEVLPAAAQQSRLVQLAQDAAADAVTVVVGCGSQAQQQELEGALQQLGPDPAIIVVCITGEGNAAPGTPQAVEAELQQLADAHASVAALGKRQVTVYAVTPDAASVQGRPHARQLQGVRTDVGVCGQLCQTQVKWLEGILAALILAVAAFSGLCCLYMLDTPTRFEKPKETARNE